MAAILTVSLQAIPQKMPEYASIEEANRDLREHLEVFVDTTNQLEISDILSDSLRSGFRPLAMGDEPTSLSHTYWMMSLLSE